ncbi:hypothetical protein [Pedococcus sp. 5OH_020]|uniref:hypothetical protein n=1 Tax=Pedococcus sp. 5OH_020 TaxID=2989814 RepID=UPI0022E9FF2B|nr:hypothetical protein [Pedococcus sp. 5OH_020]
MSGGAADEEPETTAHIEEFSKISEVEVEAPGARVRLRGAASLWHLVRLAFAGIFTVMGFAGCISLLVAKRPYWLATAVLIIGLLLAWASWKLASRRPSN